MKCSFCQLECLISNLPTQEAGVPLQDPTLDDPLQPQVLVSFPVKMNPSSHLWEAMVPTSNGLVVSPIYTVLPFERVGISGQAISVKKIVSQNS